MHVYANVLDLLREVKNIVRQLSRVIPGRQFPKTVASRIGGFDGPWHARVHKFLNDYIHMRVYAYRHAPTDVPTHAATRRDTHREKERETRTHTAASDCLAYLGVASRDAREMDKKQYLLLYPLAVVWLVDFFCTH